MKVKSLKDLEAYIYAQVILPLKDLQAPSINLGSPMSDGDMRIELHVWRPEIDYGQHRRDYQRRIARSKQPYIVSVDIGYGERRNVAEYNPRGHSVVIYKQSLRGVSSGGVLLGKLEEAFKTNTPFTKVVATNESGGL